MIKELSMSNKKTSYPSFGKVLAGVMAILVINCMMKYFGGLSVSNSAEKAINNYAQAHGYSRSDYPDELVKLLESNSETEEFVLNYPEMVSEGAADKIDLTQYTNCKQPPLLMQWDSRWGYMSYNDSVMGLNGSVPTCLSMTAIYKLQDVSMSPVYMADMAVQNGWASKPEKLLTEGARSIGLNVAQLPVSEGKLSSSIQSGSTVICLTDGKLLSTAVVIYAMDENGGYKINDPMSKEKSGKTYTYSEINKNIRKMWEYSTQT